MKVVLQPVGVRPLLFSQEEDHPLTLEQRNGITRERAMEIAFLLLHKAGSLSS